MGRSNGINMPCCTLAEADRPRDWTGSPRHRAARQEGHIGAKGSSASINSFYTIIIGRIGCEPGNIRQNCNRACTGNR